MHSSAEHAQKRREDQKRGLIGNASKDPGLETRQGTRGAVARRPAKCLLIEGQAVTTVVDGVVVRADAADTSVLRLRQHGLVGERAKENRTWEGRGSCAAQAYQD